jgi:predicted nucleotidyltransferase
MQAIVKSGLGIEDLLRDKRADILRLASQYHASNVRVFGSVARGEARPDSDVDLLVDFAVGYRLWDKIGLKQDLEELLDRKVDVVHAKFVRDELASEIFKDAVPL